MRRCVYWISLTLGVLLATHAARADDSFSFTIVPNSSDVLATPGSTVGWGYSITNNSTSDYLELTDIAATVSLTEDGAPDTNIFDLPILGPGPGSTITEDYDPIAYVGLLQFTWSPDPAENPVTGNVTLSAVFCNGDPLDPSTICGDTVYTESATYSATVIPISTNVPEPSSLLLLVSGLCGIGLWTWRRQGYSVWRTTHQ